MLRTHRPLDTTTAIRWSYLFAETLDWDRIKRRAGMRDNGFVARLGDLLIGAAPNWASSLPPGDSRRFLGTPEARDGLRRAAERQGVTLIVTDENKPAVLVEQRRCRDGAAPV